MPISRNLPSPREEAREIITRSWETAITDILSLKIDKEGLLKLIYDTYEYFREGAEYNSILRADLPIYRYISEAYAHLSHDYIENITHCEHEALRFTIEGLYWAIDTAFERGYFVKSLKAGVSMHFMSYEIDMTDFSSFVAGFGRLVSMIRDSYDEEEEE